MKIIVGAVLIFAAAWLMVRLQASNGTSGGEVHKSSAADTENGQGCKEVDEIYEGGDSETGRKDKA